MTSTCIQLYSEWVHDSGLLHDSLHLSDLLHDWLLISWIMKCLEFTFTQSGGILDSVHGILHDMYAIAVTWFTHEVSRIHDMIQSYCTYVTYCWYHDLIMNHGITAWLTASMMTYCMTYYSWIHGHDLTYIYRLQNHD